MTDFTPGPWQWSPWLKNGGKFLRHPGSDGYLPEVILYISRPSQPTDANARLIAAAPQLYEALEASVSWAVCTHPDNGDQHCILCKKVGDPGGEIAHLPGCPITAARAALAAARGDAC